VRGLLVSPLAFLIGISLGALGGGGSILAVPALVYGAGEPAKAATSTSLLVVGVAALMGMGSHWRAGRVRLGPGLLFGAVGLGGAAVGTALNRLVNPDVLLLAFSFVMIVAAVAMWRRASPAPPPAPAVAGDGSTAVGAVPVTTVRLDARTVAKIVVAGTLVGLLTGFFGVGGGFVIVPALVLSLGFSMPEAVGTSLVVIALNAAMALALRAGSLDIRWGDALPFIVMAVLGTLVGRRIADRLPAATLTRGFVVLLVLVAIYTAASSVAALA
jgi:hypothetical protein